MPNGAVKEEKIGYDYKEIIVKRDNASFLLDSYEKLGWQLDKHQICPNPAGNLAHQDFKVILRLKRNRKIINKMELSRLQSNFEGCMRDIEKMERNKISVSSLTAIILGCSGVLFLALAGVLFFHSWQLLAWLFAGIGIVACILPVKVYQEVLEQQTEKFAPLIKATYQEIESILDKGNKLIY